MFTIFTVSQGSITFFWFVFSVSSQARFFLAIFPDAVETIVWPFQGHYKYIFYHPLTRDYSAVNERCDSIMSQGKAWLPQKPTKSVTVLQFSKSATIPQAKYQKSANSVAFLCIKAKRDHPIGHKKGHHIASQRKVSQPPCVS